MENKLISIVTASYNYEDYIKETIESVINQTYTNWELIIVDDGSKDNSVEVIKSYCKKDKRIKLFQHEGGINRGLVETVKLGISKAQSEWITFLESDDTIIPEYLEKKVKVMNEHPEVKFIFNDANLFGSEERIRSYDLYFEKIKQIFAENPYPKNLLKYFKELNLVPTFSVVTMKKELFQNIDFNSPIKAYLDYYLWIQIVQKTPLYFIDEKLTNWRMHDSYIMNVNFNIIQKIKFEYKRKTILIPKAFKIFIFVYYCLLYIRKNIIKIHFKDKEIFLLGHKYSLFS